MKTKILSVSIGLLAMSALLFSGCEKDMGDKELSPNGQKVTITETGNGCTPIYAGQNTLAGEVCLDDIDTNNDGISDALQVTYTAFDTWCFDEIHFDIGTNLTDIAMNKKGNLVPGQFPFHFTNLNCATSYTFTIPFSFWGFNCDPEDLLYAAAHCVVKRPDNNGGFQTETGWGYGNDQPGNSWGTIFSFKIDCGDDNTEEEECETAFAYNQNGTNGTSRFCFLDLKSGTDNGINDGDYYPAGTPSDNFNRWGWTNKISEGTYSFQIWAAAGQCNTANGTQVGTLNITYSAGTATVTFNTTGGFTMDEVHLYVGSAVLPSDNGSFTVAPGQYPIVDEVEDATSVQKVVTGLSGDVYVVAHAVVCGQY